MNETKNDEAVSPVIATILMVAITVVLAGVLYVWAQGLAADNAQGGFEKATYGATDANGQLTTDTADKLISLSWSTAPSEGLLWSRVQVNVIDNNDQRHACDEATGGTGKCIITQLEAGSGSDAAKDARWNPAEELRIDENGAEIPGCTGDATSCVVKVEVLLDNALLGTIQTVTISD